MQICQHRKHPHKPPSRTHVGIERKTEHGCLEKEDHEQVRPLHDVVFTPARDGFEVRNCAEECGSLTGRTEHANSLPGSCIWICENDAGGRMPPTGVPLVTSLLTTVVALRCTLFVESSQKHPATYNHQDAA